MRFLAVFLLIATGMGCSSRPARKQVPPTAGQPRATEVQPPPPSSAIDPDAALAEMEAASQPKPEPVTPPPAVTEEAKQLAPEPPAQEPETPTEPLVVKEVPPAVPQPEIEIPPLFEERWAGVISHVRLELQKYKRW